MYKIPVLTPREADVVERIERVRSTLSYAIQDVPGRWQGLLRRSTLARAIRGSNSIEGYSVTVDDAIAITEGEEALDATAEAQAAVAGYQTAMTYVMQLANDPHFTFSPDLIRSLHYMMIHYDLTRHPGRWRPGPIYVYDDELDKTVYEGPNAERVPGLMTDLCDQLQNESKKHPPMIAAAMAHLNLVMVHPFSDGNGRMARMLQSLVLARGGTLAPQFSSIEEYLGHNTRPYYDILTAVGRGRWNPANDARPWVRFCLLAHYRQAMKLTARARELERLWNALEAELVNRDLPPRILLALADAALGWRIRNPIYRAVADITENTASRDLRAAVEAGLLVAHGEKRGRFYKASPLVLAIRQRVSERPDIPDPFEGPGD